LDFTSPIDIASSTICMYYYDILIFCDNRFDQWINSSKLS
jgi:hypothetical protein